MKQQEGTLRVPPIEVTFRNVRPSAWIEPDVRKRAAKLAVFRSDILSGRVLVSMPHRHHKGGNRFHVSITLRTPGGEVAVTREASLHPASTDLAARKWTKALEIESVRKNLHLVIRRAFDAARRRVQDQVRRQRGAVKVHAARALEVRAARGGPHGNARARRRTRQPGDME